MQSNLDQFRTTFLHSAVYANGELRIIVAEGFQVPDREDVTINGEVTTFYSALTTTEDSRLAVVRFKRPIAWQLIDECFTAWDDYEERDDKRKLQVLTRSKYLDYVRASHGWFESIRGSGKHYRIWTENEVVDVVACEPPTIEFTDDV